jgi:hypothetical protein
MAQVDLRLSASGTKGRLEGASLEGALLAARRQIRRRRVGRIHEDRLRRLGLPLHLKFFYRSRRNFRSLRCTRKHNSLSSPAI